MTDPASVDWAAVLAFLPGFDRPNLRAGEWRGEGFGAFYAYREEVERFVETLYSARVVYEFDWPAWQKKAERYVVVPSALRTARLATLRRLLTLHARKDRFCEGHFAAVLESGHITSILRRVQTILSGR